MHIRAFTTGVNALSIKFLQNIPFWLIALKVNADYDMGMTTVGERLQKLIDNKNYGQGEFADKIGVARSSLNRIIKGKKPLGKINQNRIAQGLGLPLGLFLWLINSDLPLENLKIFQDLAEIEDNQIISAVKALIKIGQIKNRGKIRDDDLTSLIQHIESCHKLIESLDK